MEEMTAEEISSILESDLTPDEKSSILASCDTWSKDVKPQIEDAKANTKKGKDDDGKSERNIGVKANANANAKKKELVDLDSKLTSEEKSSLSVAPSLIKDKPETCSSPSRVELKAKEKVDRDLDRTIEKKPSSLACDPKEGVNVPSSKVNTPLISSGVQPEGKDKLMGTEAKPEHDPTPDHENGPLKCILAGSSLRAQVVPAENCHFLVELKEHTRFIAKEIKEPQANSEGETIYKEEAVCKKCYEYMFDEDNVLREKKILKAKCKCKTMALIHELCAKQWSEEKGSKCLTCEEQIEYIEVTLKMAASSSTSLPQTSNVGEHEEPMYVSKGSWFCCFSA